MIDTVFMITVFLLFLAAFPLTLHQTRRIREIERQVETQDRELDRAFNRCDRLNVRITTLEAAEAQRKKHEKELNEAEAQIQKAQEIEKLWQSGMEHIQAYDYDAARKAVTGDAGE